MLRIAGSVQEPLHAVQPQRRVRAEPGGLDTGLLLDQGVAVQAPERVALETGDETRVARLRRIDTVEPEDGEGAGRSGAHQLDGVAPRSLRGSGAVARGGVELEAELPGQ